MRRIGEWEVLRELGRGGMGSVYEVRHVARGERAALKVLTGYVDDVAYKRFLREAQAGAGVEHPNVLRVLGAGNDGGRPFIVMELAEGGSLEARLHRAGALPWRDAAALGAAIARGLAALHAAGFVHRDVKPANVLFDAAGTSKIADLGLVRPTSGGSALTASNLVVGTPAYASPEQANGAAATPRSDVYGLGCTLHAALTGAPPFKGREFDVLRRHMQEPAPDVRAAAPGTPEPFARAIRRCLEKAPDARGTAEEAALALEAVLAEKPGALSVTRSSPVVLAALLALLAAGAVVLGSRRPPSTPATLAPVTTATGGETNLAPVASSDAEGPPGLPAATATPSSAAGGAGPLRFAYKVGAPRWAVAGRTSLLAVDHSARAIVAVGADPIVRVLNGADGGAAGQRLHMLEMTTPSAVDVSPDGRLVAFAARAITVATVASVSAVRFRLPLPESLRGLALRVEGDELLVALSDGTHERFAVDGGMNHRLGRAPGPYKAAAAAIARRARTVVHVLENGQARIANAGTYGSHPVGGLGDYKVDLVAVSDDGLRAAFRLRDAPNRVVLLNLPDLSVVAVPNLSNPITALAFVPDTLDLVVATKDEGLFVYEEGAAEPARLLGPPTEALAIVKDPDEITALAVARSRRAVVGFAGGGVQVWDLATRQRVSSEADLGPGAAIAVSGDGKTLGVASHEGRVTIFPADGARSLARARSYTTGVRAKQLALDQHGDAFAVAGHGRVAIALEPAGPVLWLPFDAATVSMDAWRRRLTTVVNGPVDLWDTAPRALAADGARAAMLSPDGKEALVWTDPGLQRWRVEGDPALAGVVPLAGEPVLPPPDTISWDADRSRVAVRLGTEGNRTVVIVWDTRTGARLGTTTLEVQSHVSLAVRPKRPHVAVAAQGGAVYVQNYVTGARIGSLHLRSEHDDQPRALAFSLDGGRLYVLTARGQLLVYDLVD